MSANRARTRLDRAYDFAVSALGSRPDVTGVDIGPKYVNGERTNTQVVRVHVVEKLRGKRLTASERIPESFLGVPSDVVVSSYQRHSGDPLFPSGRFDPIRPGISIGNPRAKAGTLGLIVFDIETGAACALSSYHVLAGPNAKEGNSVTQPSRFDQGTIVHDAVGTLYRFFNPGPWGDAALAKLTPERSFVRRSFDTDIVIDRSAFPDVGMRVLKTGRTTGTTRGRVEGIGTYFFEGLASGVRGFRVVPHHDDPSRNDLCGEGDSGAAYIKEGTTTGVGLHCAGGTDPNIGEVGIACMLPTVLATLRVSLKPARHTFADGPHRGGHKKSRTRSAPSASASRRR